MPKIADVLLWPLDRLASIILWPFEVFVVFLASRILDRLKRAAAARDAALAEGASQAEADAAAKRAFFRLSAG